jgi:hypothetical protein
MENPIKYPKKLSAKQRQQKKERREKKLESRFKERRKKERKQLKTKKAFPCAKTPYFRFCTPEEWSMVLLHDIPISMRHKFLTFRYKPSLLAYETRKYNCMWHRMREDKLIQPNQYPFVSFLHEFRTWFTKYASTRYQMRNLLFRWLKHKCITNPINQEDCITQLPIKKPVYIFNIMLRRSWVYEAREMYKYLLYKLSYNEDLFPNPQAPCNLLSNLPYTYETMLSIIQQLRTYQYNHWLLDAYLQCKGNLRLLLSRFYVPLQVQGLQHRCKDHNDEFVEDELLNFVEDKLEQYHQTEKYEFVKWMLKHHPSHTYCNTWKNLFQRHYLMELQDMSTTQIVQETTYITQKVQSLFLFEKDVKDLHKAYMKTQSSNLP